MEIDFFKNTFAKKIPFEALYRINLGSDIDEYLAYESFRKILHIKEEQIRTSLMSMLLNGVMVKGARVDEISGLLKAALSMDDFLSKKKKRIKLPTCYYKK